MDQTSPQAPTVNPTLTSKSKKAYHAPKLSNYGDIATMVQRRPGIGGDGGPADCNLS